MLNENEVIMLILGIGILSLISVYRSKIKRVFAYETILIAFYLLIASWICTILEDIFFYRIMNLLEHVFFAASAVVTLIWCWRVASRQKQEARQ